MTDVTTDPCERFRELVSGRLDGAIKSAEEDELVLHLKGCTGCSDHHDRLTQVVNTLRAVGPFALGPGELASRLSSIEGRLADELASPGPSVDADGVLPPRAAPAPAAPVATAPSAPASTTAPVATPPVATSTPTTPAAPTPVAAAPTPTAPRPAGPTPAAPRPAAAPTPTAPKPRVSERLTPPRVSERAPRVSERLSPPRPVAPTPPVAPSTPPAPTPPVAQPTTPPPVVEVKASPPPVVPLPPVAQPAPASSASDEEPEELSDDELEVVDDADLEGVALDSEDLGEIADELSDEEMEDDDDEANTPVAISPSQRLRAAAAALPPPPSSTPPTPPVVPPPESAQALWSQPEFQVGANRRHGLGELDWRASAWQVGRIVVPIAFLIAAALFLKDRAGRITPAHGPIAHTDTRPPTPPPAPGTDGRPTTEPTQAPPVPSTDPFIPPSTFPDRPLPDPDGVGPIAPPEGTERIIVQPPRRDPNGGNPGTTERGPGAPVDDDSGQFFAKLEQRSRTNGDVKALERLVRQIEDSRTPPDVRSANVAALCSWSNVAGTYAVLANILQKGSCDGFPGANEAREAAYAALGEMGTVQAAKVILESPLRPTHRDADGAACLAALCAFGPWADTTPAVVFIAEAVVKLPDAPDDDRRALVVEALTRMRRPEATEGLMDALQSKKLHPPARRDVAVALGACGAPAAYQPLADALGSSRDVEVKQGAARGLGLLSGRVGKATTAACFTALERAFSDADVSVALAAALGLGSSRRSAVPLLLAHFDPKRETRARVRGAARESLLRLTGQSFATVAEWHRWLNEPPVAFKPGGVLALAADPKAFFAIPAESDGVAYLLDHSGSMDAKWELATFELGRSLDALTPRRVPMTIFLFADTPQPFSNDLVPAEYRTVKRAKEWIQLQGKPRAGRVTNLGPGLIRALKLRAIDTIYLVTDGAGREDPEQLRVAVNRLNHGRKEMVRIHTVLLRTAGDPVKLDDGAANPKDSPQAALLRGLARDSGGIFAHN